MECATRKIIFWARSASFVWTSSFINLDWVFKSLQFKMTGAFRLITRKCPPRRVFSCSFFYYDAESFVFLRSMKDSIVGLFYGDNPMVCLKFDVTWKCLRLNNLASRASSFLFLYTVIQEAVFQWIRCLKQLSKVYYFSKASKLFEQQVYNLVTKHQTLHFYIVVWKRGRIINVA